MSVIPVDLVDQVKIPHQFEGIFIEILDHYYHGDFTRAQQKLNDYYIPEHPSFGFLRVTILSKLNDFDRLAELIDQWSPLAKKNSNTRKSNVDALLVSLARCHLFENEAIMSKERQARTIIKQEIDYFLSIASIQEWFETKHEGRVWNFWLSYILKFLTTFAEGRKKEGEQNWSLPQKIDIHKQLSTIFEGEQNWIEYIWALRNIGNMYHTTGESEKANQSFLTALDIAKRIDFQQEIFGLYNNLGVMARIHGNYDDALNWYKQALLLTESQQLEKHRGMVQNNLGAIYFYKSELQVALDYYNQALSSYQDFGNKKQIASAIDNIGEVYFYEGNYQQAINYYKDGLELRQEVGISRDIATSLDNLGLIYQNTGELDIAMDYYTQSFTLREEIDNPMLLAKSYRNLGIINQIRGDFESATQFLQQVVNVWEQENNPYELIKAYFDLVLLAVEQDDMPSFEKYSNTITSLIEKLSSSPREIQDIATFIQIFNLKSHNRQKYKFKALEYLEELVPTLDYNFDLQYFGYLLILELMVFELNTFYEEEVKEEINAILSQLKRKTREQNALPKLYRLGLFEVELALLDLEIELAEEILIQISLNTEELGLQLLNSQINQYYLNFLDYRDEIAKLRTKEASLDVILSKSSIGTTIEKLTKLSSDLSVQYSNVDPKMFLIIKAEVGTTIYSKTFDDEFSINEILIGAVLTAINSFMQETFHSKEGLHQIEHGENVVLFSQVEDVIFCYLFSGSPEGIISQLHRLRELIVTDEELWKTIRTFNNSISHTSLEQLDAYIKEVLLST